MGDTYSAIEIRSTLRTFQEYLRDLMDTRFDQFQTKLRLFVNFCEKDDTFRGGAVENLKAFVESIRTGKLINNADHGAESTLTAILGRMAAYTGKPVTWDEMMKSNDRWETKVPI